MKRLMAKSVAEWEDDGGARRAALDASTVRSRNQDQASRVTEGKPGSPRQTRRSHSCLESTGSDTKGEWIRG
jgi:hypothetical protein